MKIDDTKVLARPALFKLIRDVDETGVSGTGHVADGVRFSTGKCVISWRVKTDSLVIYDSIDEVRAIHGHGGQTRVQWEHCCESFFRLADGTLGGECGMTRGHTGSHFDERNGRSWT